MSKVLITGATGFIGNHVTRLCLEQGNEVRVMVMPGEDRSPLAGMQVEFVEGNLLDPESLAKAVRGVNQMYHLAALFAVDEGPGPSLQDQRERHAPPDARREGRGRR
jgi:dihydroflavonol-4-reductase